MTDVFDALVGQESAVAAMRQYVKAPVHAYLLSGPVGSSLHDAALTFAAALQCPRNGCGECETCRLVLSEGDADVYSPNARVCRGESMSCEKRTA